MYNFVNWNKDENVHRFACAIRGELLERKRDSFEILYTGYIFYIVNIKREIEKDRKRKKIERRVIEIVRERERKREIEKREREKERERERK